jgi:hypothetical protein
MCIKSLKSPKKPKLFYEIFYEIFYLSPKEKHNRLSIVFIDVVDTNLDSRQQHPNF